MQNVQADPPLITMDYPSNRIFLLKSLGLICSPSPWTGLPRRCPLEASYRPLSIRKSIFCRCETELVRIISSNSLEEGRRLKWISLSVLCSCCETDPLSGIQNNHHTEKDQKTKRSRKMKKSCILSVVALEIEKKAYWESVSIFF